MVYAFTPPQAMRVTASTCGSGFDTLLLLGAGGLQPDTTLVNDDDPGCSADTSNSRIDQVTPTGRRGLGGGGEGLCLVAWLHV